MLGYNDKLLFLQLGGIEAASLGSGPDEKVASDFTSVPDPSARRLHSLLDEFYAAVLGAAVLGSVVGDGFVRALTYGTHVERIAA